MAIEDGEKAEGKHPDQRRKTRRGQQKRDYPDRDIGNDLMEQLDRLSCFYDRVRLSQGWIILLLQPPVFRPARYCKICSPSLPAIECIRVKLRTAGRSPGAWRSRR